MNKPPAIFLMGPTAAGKTAAAILLHQKYSTDIISVDSALVYRGMDIGTAKPDRQTLKQAPHALLDICEPWQPYSASNFCTDARRLMQQSSEQNRIPLLAGGTMLYYQALQHGLSKLPTADAETRHQIQQLANRKGWQHIHQKLTQIDPQSAAKIHPNDPQRINRAYEVYLLTGKPLSHWFKQQKPKLPYRLLKIIIAPKDRAILHQTISQRFEQMLEQGFLEEVKKLMENPKIHSELPAIRSVGYRQAWQHLSGQIDRQQLIAQATAATRQLAKRQLTWLRKETNAICLDPTEPAYLAQLTQHIEEFIE